jgi:uncharacterized repeat protein (TIGR04076 family)
MIQVRQCVGKTDCAWHKAHSWDGHVYIEPEIFTGDVCPILWHTLYPYFLGALFGARYHYNKQGDCPVCCPAEFGIDVFVKVRPNDGKFPAEVQADWRDVIHAEVVKVNGLCDYGHKVGDRFVFPTCRAMMQRYACPAGINNLFPFLQIKRPKCINLARMRCPDWQENIYYSLERND